MNEQQAQQILDFELTRFEKKCRGTIEISEEIRTDKEKLAVFMEDFVNQGKEPDSQKQGGKERGNTQFNRALKVMRKNGKFKREKKNSPLG